IRGTSGRNLAGRRVGGHPIATLENLLEQVGGRVPLLLEIKVEGDLQRWGSALKRDLGRYDGQFAVLSFDPRIIRLLGSELPGVRRGLNISDGLLPLRRALSIRRAGPDFLGVELAALGKHWVTTARRSMPVYSW